MKKGRFLILAILLLTSMVLLLSFSKQTLQLISRAFPKKANILIDTKTYQGPIQQNWRAIAQGGEQQGVRMFEKVVYQASALKPRYIRIDHIYDFYDVVDRDENGDLVFNWDQLDQTVCDIYRIGAKPFFVLSYMPLTLSNQGTLISEPKDWKEWAYTVQSTIERYSGINTRICGGVYGDWLKDIYYEVWNEPDLETFGKWSIYGGSRDYKTLYYYSSLGAKNTRLVNRFYLGGPVTTRAYRNWFTTFLDYVKNHNLKLDFISWHHYSEQTNDYANEIAQINSWLLSSKYVRYAKLPKIITEWGFDSDPNPIADTNIGAAHTVATILNLIHDKVEMAFAFEMIDGLNPTWGIFTNDGRAKPRFYALKMLNALGKHEVLIEGEGTYVKGIASINSPTDFSLILVNYDLSNKNNESVPVQFTGLKNGNYQLVTRNLAQQTTTESVIVTDNRLSKNIIMPPNDVALLELQYQD